MVFSAQYIHSLYRRDWVSEGRIATSREDGVRIAIERLCIQTLPLHLTY
jgi:hypothetical protein